eukprot:GHVU01118360.1.p1 GENE.GHVU01118360.1~~GHVU01118360.1.p1  ORF type:complete len:416 (-),score=70.05 GHVU01118360.1:1079-2326(-)
MGNSCNHRWSFHGGTRRSVTPAGLHGLGLDEGDEGGLEEVTGRVRRRRFTDLGGSSFPLRPLAVSARVRLGDIRSAYSFDPPVVLGTGFGGPVVLATHKWTGTQFAVKPLRKKGVSPQQRARQRNEATVYLSIDHPNISRLVEVWEDAINAYMVMEVCTGGELYDRLLQKHRYTEGDVQTLTLQMLRAIHYLHANNIVHRDLKLENWLFASADDDAPLKLIDFGLSKFWDADHDEHMTSVCGSLFYMSPDTLQRCYSNKCDMWSLGVIVYMLLAGDPPFHATTNEGLRGAILKGNFRFDARPWTEVSAAAKDFVHALLTVDPAVRLSAKQALQHDSRLCPQHELPSGRAARHGLLAPLRGDPRAARDLPQARLAGERTHPARRPRRLRREQQLRPRTRAGDSSVLRDAPLRLSEL